MARYGCPAAIPGRGWFSYGLGIVKVARRLGEQEEELVCPDRAVDGRFWGGVVLFPDDIAAQVPAVRLQRQSHPPGNAYQVLRLEAVCGATAAPAPAIEAVPEVQPERAGRLQHAAHVAQQLDRVGDEQLWRRLQAQAPQPGAATLAEPASIGGCRVLVAVEADAGLPRRGVGGTHVFAPAALHRAPAVPAVGVAAPDAGRHLEVAKSPVGWTRNRAVDAVGGQLREHLAGIAEVHRDRPVLD